MFNTAFRIIGERTEAEDVLQEAFVNAFKNLSSYRGDATFGAWLKKIVINKALSALQKSKKDLLIMTESEDRDVVDDAPHDAEPAYHTADIKRAIRELPTGFRTVLSLYLFEGYDHQEISEILDISESTSKTQYKRAKDKLKTLLKKEMNYG